jgi:polysaccharide pyruvyl transferase WcaK-like protein
MLDEKLGNGRGLRKHGPYRLVILGGFGFDNLGDDLILRSALAQLRKALGNVEITVLSNNPCETAARHRGEAVIFSAEALLRQIVLRALVRVSGHHRRYLLPIPGDSFRRLLVSLWKSDLVVSLGGGYLNDYSKFLTHSRLAELILIGLCRKRLVLYSHEIGPLRRLSLRLLASFTLKFVTYATVRDETSLQVLLDLGIRKEQVKVTADEGWAYDPKISPTSRSRMGLGRELVMAVNLMPFKVLANVFRSTTIKPLKFEELNDHILSVMLSSLESFTSRGLRLLLLPMSSNDLEVCSKLQAQLHGRVPCEIVSDLDSQYAALTRSHVLVAMRMHTIMMAAQVGAPPVAIAVLPKVRKMMKDIGLSEYVVQGLQLDANAFQDTLNRALQNADNIRTLMSERAMSLRERGSLNVKVVGALLYTT